MNFEFFKQRYEGKISVGDELAVFSNDDDDGIPSGRWKVAELGADPDGYVQAMLVGMNNLAGHVCSVPIDAHE